MRHDVPVTDLIKALRSGDESAFEKLYECFLREAYQIAKSKLDPRLLNRTSPESIATQALRDCLDKGRFSNSQGLRSYLKKVIKGKAIDAARRATAKKRDIGLESDVDSTSLSSNSSPTPIDVAMANELAIQVVHKLLEAPDETRRTIRLLGVLLGFSGAQIADMIAPLAPEGRPAISTINRLISSAKRDIDDIGGGMGVDE